jgi:group I intron endonuclease
MENQSGIYEIVNTVNGKRYIGSARELKTRWRRHRWELRGCRHGNEKLQRAWNKYGEGAFKFLPILMCQPSMLLFYEQQLLDKVKPEYNIAVRAGAPTAGTKLTSLHKERIGAAHKGKIVSAETRARSSASHKGFVPSAEARAKLSTAGKGRVLTEEHKARISAAHIGRTASPEARVKMSEAAKRRANTAEGREHLANAANAQWEKRRAAQ